MTISKDEKQQQISRFQHHDKDTGSAEVQVSLLTERIKYLTEHFKTHKKDHHSRRGLLMMVSRRRKLLEYLRRNANPKYLEVIRELNLRK